MALYYEAAPLLQSDADRIGSLKSQIFNSLNLKSKPLQLYALVTEAIKWSTILSEVIEKSQLLKAERKVQEVALFDSTDTNARNWWWHSSLPTLHCFLFMIFFFQEMALQHRPHIPYGLL